MGEKALEERDWEEYGMIARMICGAFDIPTEVRTEQGKAMVHYPTEIHPFSEIFVKALKEPLKEPLSEYFSMSNEVTGLTGKDMTISNALSGSRETGIYLYDELLAAVRFHLPEQKGWIIVGPALIKRPTPWERSCLISAIMEQTEPASKIAEQLRKEVTEYVDSFPVYTIYKLIQLVQFCHWSIHRELIGWNEIFAGSSERKQQEICTMQVKETALRRELVRPHNSYFQELEEQEAVRSGKVEWMKKLMKRPMVGTPGTLSEDPLRNEKNLFISSIAIWTRKAVEGGVTQEEAYNMSDAYIYQSEHSRSIQEVHRLRSQAAIAFTQKVAEQKKSIHSPMVEKSIDYIYNHLHETIYLKQIANHIPVSLSYLCRIFKKETGVTLAEYMQRERMEEAKKRLRFSQDSYLEIATSLNYKTQSYFISVFKKQEGVTPAEYRRKMAIGKKTE